MGEVTDRDWEVWDATRVTSLLNNEWGPPGALRRGRHWELLQAISTLIEKDPFTILDVACGMGHFAAILHESINVKHYRGVDYSASMLSIAKEWKEKYHPNDDTFKFLQGDAWQLGLHHPADYVTCIDLMMHLPETMPVLEQLWNRANKYMIVTWRIDRKEWITRRPYLRDGDKSFIIGDGKMLILRAETLEHLYSLFAKLPSLGHVERYFYDTRTEIFKLHKNVQSFLGRGGVNWVTRSLPSSL